MNISAFRKNGHEVVVDCDERQILSLTHEEDREFVVNLLSKRHNELLIHWAFEMDYGWTYFEEHDV